MNEMVLAALLGAVVAGLGGLLVPVLIGRVPEPEPRPEADEQPKTTYAEIGGRPGLGLRSAVVSAVVGAVLGGATGLDWPLVWLLPLTPVAVALSVVDWHTRLLPRVVVVPATLATLAVVTAVGLATDERTTLLGALGGMVGLRTFFWLLWFIRSAGMGFGDVRLAALVGLVLGWEGLDVLLVGAWIGFVSFALPGVALAVVRRDRSLLRKPFPYGPFMVGGALAGLVWGTALAGRVWG